MADAARARKVADRIKTLIAAGLDQVVKDPDLGFVTITDVRVTNDLQHASVFYTVFGDDAQRAKTAELLAANRGKLRSHVGRNLGIRLTPSLEFIADAIPETAAHLEVLLAEARERDAQVAAAASGATYAGDADPYRHDDDEEDDEDADEAPATGATSSATDGAAAATEGARGADDTGRA
ncbi:ribosome-binding factor A [Knoellia flava TL1]|uniref:Ribosome-binding factor A n=2 Tax=Knoellia flava TaxID=913969 RepID=A0A8H9KV61_9MICO|nr:30S ribosome-binding factor RbfA [Knoellia flava]KGN28977.1 ribosome-binding factor A [Knoellia flava TL1]GGB86692.1 ribosome-binding factor A [Knoellia flava]